MSRRLRTLNAITWGLDEVERQLRDEPAHRLKNEQDEPHHWSFEAPAGVGVWVETGLWRPVGTSAVEIGLLGGATGLFRRTQLKRQLTVPLTGHAARVPSVLYLVFASGGLAYAFETPEEASDSLDSLDLDFDDGHYLGAYSDQGEVLTVTAGATGSTLHPSGATDPAALNALIRNSRTFSESANDPHIYALAVWRAG